MKKRQSNNQPLKVVCLTPHLFIGGAERLMIDIFSRLDRRRFQPQWCCLEGDSVDSASWRLELERAGIEVAVLASDQKPKQQVGRLWRLIVIGWRLWRHLRKTRPDIVQTQLFADIYRPIARLAGVPIIISVEHNLDYDEPAWTRLAKIISRWAVDGIIAVSQAVKQDIIQRYHYLPEKIEVIYNGVDLDKFFKPVNQLNLTNQNQPVWRLGAIGRLTKQKGFDVLIEALAALPKEINWQCSIAGSGPQASHLNSLITKFGLSNQIKLVGLQTDVPKFLAGLDLLVVPSRWEGLGLVILEAGAAGVPVVASQVDGIVEIVSHQNNGYLVEAGSVNQLTKGLTDVLTAVSPDERLTWAINLQKTVKENFSIIKTVEQYQNYYERIK
jgi:glycosyltransferase involved in cell wall biosynthesis